MNQSYNVETFFFIDNAANESFGVEEEGWFYRVLVASAWRETGTGLVNATEFILNDVKTGEPSQLMTKLLAPENRVGVWQHIQGIADTRPGFRLGINRGGSTTPITGFFRVLRLPARG